MLDIIILLLILVFCHVSVGLLLVLDNDLTLVTKWCVYFYLFLYWFSTVYIFINIFKKYFIIDYKMSLKEVLQITLINILFLVLFYFCFFLLVIYFLYFII